MYKDAHTYLHRKHDKAIDLLKLADAKQEGHNQFSSRHSFNAGTLSAPPPAYQI
jgi:hypothetical protein